MLPHIQKMISAGQPSNQLEIIGEALKVLRKTDLDVTQEIPDLHRIVGPRNILAHGYMAIDDEVVWTAASMRVPELLWPSSGF